MATGFIANAQSEWSGCLITMTSPKSGECSWENDSISFSFLPTELFWRVKIQNKFSNKIICNWDDVLFNVEDKTSGIVFDNTIRLKMNDSNKEPNCGYDPTACSLVNRIKWQANPVSEKIPLGFFVILFKVLL